ncbi:uncharacterized protein LOC117814722 [Notolabrus celidotus]|uniref:uncharacterized protein LOC117814722 n=1 Tax=Notolabrus celidotus TaxID=1203425 RepID=UPI00149044A2|nr:uncharacterized protein LOC117814722 [Notolabrus celidotus]
MGLRGNFLLQFEDPDFGNELCNLTDIKELPTDRATLKVLITFSDAVSDSTLDTASLSSPSNNSSVEWPDPFIIPDFSHDVELQLTAANDAYAKEGTVMVVSKGVKSEILDKLADMISKVTAYPSKEHYESVATALVAKHPCLRELGSEKGWYCWVFSLKFKMGNYRQRLMAAGCPEVVVNKRKRGQTSSKVLKKSKKGEVHYLPDPPAGQSAFTSEENRKTMLLEVQKCDPDLQLLDEMMTATFSQRRKEVIGDEPPVSELVNRWPALFNERQIRAEFGRIVTTDLLSFLEGLDAWTPSLLQLCKAAISSSRRLTLQSVMQCLEKEDTNQNRRTAVLLGLPGFFAEDTSEIIRMCDVHGETLDVLMKGMRVGLLIGHEGVLHDAFPMQVFHVAVVVEETIILHDIPDVATGFALLMGTIYCLNLEYPSEMKCSFEFMQRVVMKIKPDHCSARIHGLRNKLLRYRL